jgi:hypothetical protein
MRFRPLTATAVALLTLGSSAAVMAGSATAVTPATQTVTVTPYYALSTTAATSVDVKLTGFTGVSPVVSVEECSPKVITDPTLAATNCDLDTQTPATPDVNGAAEIPTFSALSTTYSDTAGNKCDALDPCAIYAVDATTPTDHAGTPIYFGPYVSAAPSTNVKNKEKIALTVAGFTDSEKSGGAITVECSPAAAKFITNITKAEKYCDVKSLGGAVVGKDGSGFGTFVVAGGAGYVDSAHDKCDGTHPCFVVVADSLAAKQFAFTTITFAKSVITPVGTSTKVTGPKKGKTGKTVAISATTKPKSKFGALTGKVVFTDNGKKVATVTEKASGKVSTKIKLKAGKNKIAATYKGSSHYASSKGSLTVTGK